MKRPGIPRRRRRPAASAEERRLRARWKAAVGRCQVCPVEPGSECSGRVQGHHIIAQGALKRRGLARLAEVLWDLRNKLDVCEHRHEQHTSTFKRIPASAIPSVAREFAREHELEWWLDRFYV